MNFWSKKPKIALSDQNWEIVSLGTKTPISGQEFQKYTSLKSTIEAKKSIYGRWPFSTKKGHFFSEIDFGQKINNFKMTQKIDPRGHKTENRDHFSAKIELNAQKLTVYENTLFFMSKNRP